MLHEYVHHPLKYKLLNVEKKNAEITFVTYFSHVQ